MYQSIIEALYFGKVDPWESRVGYSPERVEIEHKIEGKRRWFAENLTPEYYEQFKAYESLYNRAAKDSESELFAYSFAVGAMFMMEMMARREKILYDDNF